MLTADNYPVGYPFDADDVNFPVDGLKFVGLMSMMILQELLYLMLS